MTREESRRAAQLARMASGEELEVGDPAGCPLAPDELARVDGHEPFVVEERQGGLTARVFRLRLGGRDWTLKRARVPAQVHNVDGQTSFLNEVQRRADLRALQAAPGGAARLAGVVETRYASLRRGIILSPWIEGGPVAEWDERRLRQVLGLLVELALGGLFEWDPSPGNVLDDGRRLWLFDFGYTYRYDPLREHNSSGLDAPLFHPVERFETRTHSAWLLALERSRGLEAALRAFRLEKAVALEAQLRLSAELSARGATPAVLGPLEARAAGWRAALGGDLARLYRAECWRAHRLDVNDDLSGSSCTPTTLARLDWLLATARQGVEELTAQGALFGEDRGRSAADLVRSLEEDRARARSRQVRG